MRVHIQPFRFYRKCIFSIGIYSGCNFSWNGTGIFYPYPSSCFIVYNYSTEMQSFFLFDEYTVSIYLQFKNSYISSRTGISYLFGAFKLNNPVNNILLPEHSVKIIKINNGRTCSNTNIKMISVFTSRITLTYKKYHSFLRYAFLFWPWKYLYFTTFIWFNNASGRDQRKYTDI